MYLPSHFEETNTGTLRSLIKAHPLGAWVVQAQSELLINHIPFLLDITRGSHGTLCAHVARANPVWRQLSTPMPSAVIFQGAQSYISPNWYPSKQETHRAVPTWNYAVVHAHGIPRIIEDKDWLLQHVSQLTQNHEAQQANPWQLTDAPADFISQKLGAIVGIEIPIDKLVGKWKLGQNRSDADQLGTIDGLNATGDTRSTELAQLMAKRLK